ncbi:MAG: outer membrane lipoprotein-sorting protein [Methylococcales bacterium]
MNRKIIITAFWGLLLLSPLQYGMAEDNYHLILEQADKARGNRDGITWRVKINAREKYKQYFVRALGFDLLAETVSPARYKGNKILMVTGNMWFYKPGLSKPVPISRRQKLLGEASYGDISSTNYANDYEIESVTDDLIDDEPCWLFSLRSKSKEDTYDRIQYWIEKKRGVGIKADYYTVSGKRIKSAGMEYRNNVPVADEERLFISQIQISDAFIADSVTVLEFSQPKIEAIPDYYFNVNFLRK